MFDELTKSELNYLTRKLLSGVRRYRQNLTLVFKVDEMEVELYDVFKDAADAHMDKMRKLN